MKKISFLMLLSFLLLGCNNEKQKSIEKEPLAIAADTTKPQINLRVNKTYDDKGNLVRYDSTYTYYYSSPGGATQHIKADSFYTVFDSIFHRHYDDLVADRFKMIFFNDSLLQYDFLNNDFFYKRFELNEPQVHDLLKDMDSLKTDMLQRLYPGGIMKRQN